MAQIRLSTTGTLSPVPINDLGAVEFVHPTVDFVLYDTSTPQTSEFTIEQIRDSSDLQEAIDLGYITISDELGNPITSIEQEVSSSAIDGDHLAIDYLPANYTRTLDPVVPTDELIDLTSHLKGIDDELATKLDSDLKGAANGLAELDGTGKVPASQLPSYVDDVEEYANLAGFPVTGEAGKIYVALDTNQIYRWTGSTYVEISAGAGAPVTSVNTQTGAVVLDADDIDDTTTTNKFVTAADLTTLSNTSGTNTGDQTATTTDVTPTGDLTSTNVQDALVELQGDIDALEEDSHTHANLAQLDTIDATDVTNLSNLSGTNSGDEVEEYANLASFPATGTAGIIYVDETTGLLYRWDGAAYASIGGGTAPVDSVNGFTGVVVLDADDIDDSATAHKFVSASDLTNLSNLSGVNTGDQTSIVGITGTKAEFDTALTDGDFLYVGDVTSNVTTDLSVGNKTATTLDVVSSDGTDATIPSATATEAGLLSAADKVKIDGITDTDDQTAEEVTYSNTTSGLTATDVQGAIDEVENRIDTLEGVSHDALTLDTDLDTTEQAANLVGQELELLKATPTTDGVMSSEDKSKLDGIEAGAEANTVDSVNGETGVVVLTTGDITEDANKKYVTDADITNLGNLSGINSGDEVESYANLAGFPGTGSTTVIYIAEDTNKLYRWDGAAYVEIGAGADDQTATEVSVTPTGNLTSTNVQDALVELQGDIDGFVSTDDQTASEVPYTNTTSGLTATDVQAAIDEIEARVDVNDTKVSNVTTDLSVANRTATTLDVVSSDGTDATLPEASITEAGLLTASDKGKIDNLLSTKSGNEPVANFLGNPKQATVTFATAFPDASYSIILTPEVDNANASYAPSYLSKTASGFTISLGTNSTANLMSVDWTAIYYGES